MAVFLYNLALRLYSLAVVGAAFLTNNKKAKLWVAGRKNWRELLKKQLEALPQSGNRLWIHAASLGEFEQGRPLMEKYKEQYPTAEIILTFFSPSGYEVMKGYKLADIIAYLPLDSKQHAADFVGLVQPSLVFFIKYEFWYHYLKSLHQRSVPTYLVAGVFLPQHPFFQWYGGLFREMLSYYTTLFVQDENSVQLLKTIAVPTEVLVCGDTRYDRVLAIAEQGRKLPEIERFCNGESTIIAGSTWPNDEELLAQIFTKLPENTKLIIAPHEIDEGHLLKIEELFVNNSIRHSGLESTTTKRVLIIDSIGLLSTIYRYGSMAYIGGGLSKTGIHNVLEPAVFGLPVVFGPHYTRYIEAVDLVKRKFAFPISNAAEASTIFEQLIQDKEALKSLQQEIKGYVASNAGATDFIVKSVSTK